VTISKLVLTLQMTLHLKSVPPK